MTKKKNRLALNDNHEDFGDRSKGMEPRAVPLYLLMQNLSPKVIVESNIKIYITVKGSSEDEFWCQFRYPCEKHFWCNLPVLKYVYLQVCTSCVHNYI